MAINEGVKALLGVLDDLCGGLERGLVNIKVARAHALRMPQCEDRVTILVALDRAEREIGQLLRGEGYKTESEAGRG